MARKYKIGDRVASRNGIWEGRVVDTLSDFLAIKMSHKEKIICLHRLSAISIEEKRLMVARDCPGKY
jgi:hypothetical protein